MRLLSTTEVRLHDVYGTDTPPYAILSHRWGDEEVLLQDIVRLRGSWDSLDQNQDKENAQIIAKKGFGKLVKAVELARRNKLEFIWVDTCCIDKTSSAELSEAINSMYHWYEAADTCYTYLIDVKAAFIEDMFAPNSSFRLSNWFTRGWTLQELIAPSEVDFFASDWSYLGNKRESNVFVNMLQHITGVPHAILSGELHPTDASVASRMAWAANRETTRLEDTAYSLLGIFDVNMPLLYGEGEKAFIRLQEQILSQSDDETIFAWHEEPSDKALWGLLAARPSCFRDSGDMVSISRLSLGVPWSLTSKGLEVKFGLREWVGSGDTRDADYYVILNCYGPESSKASPIIFLKRIWLDQFARVSPQTRMPRGSVQRSSTTVKMETVYVNQKPSQRSQKVLIEVQNSLDRVFTVAGNAQAVKVIDAHPRSCWTGFSVILKPNEFRLNEALALFRVDVRGHGIFEIAAGLHLVNEKECRSWCVQQRAGESRWSVEGNFWVMNQLLRDKRVKRVESRTGEDVHGERMPLLVQVMESLGANTLEILITISTQWVPPASTESNPVIEDVNRPFSDLEVITLNGMPLVSQEKGTVPEKPPTRCIAFHALECTKNAKQIYVDEKNTLGKEHSAWADSRTFDHDESVDWQALVKSKRHLHAMCRRRIIPPLDRKAFYSRCFQKSISRSELEKVPMAELSATDPYIQFSPLQWAILGRLNGTVTYLLERLPSLILYLTPCGISVFHVAAAIGDHPMLNRLVEYVLKSDSLSLERDNWQMRFEAKSNLGTPELDTPLHFAVAFAREDNFWRNLASNTVMFFSYYASRPNSWNLVPLSLAALTGNMVATNSLTFGLGNQTNWFELLSPWASSASTKMKSIDSMGRTLVWYAAYGNCSGVFTALYKDHLPALDLADDEGFAPIHIACMLGHVASLSELLDRGANINAATSDLTLLPTHVAAIYGQLECLDVLAKRGAAEEWDREAIPTAPPYTALALAVANGHYFCARYLWGKKHVSISGLVPCVILHKEEMCVETFDMTVNGGNFHSQRVKQDGPDVVGHQD